MAEAAREQIIIDVQTVGVEKAERETGRLASSLDRLDAAQGRQTASGDKANAAAERSAQARATAERAAARLQRQIDAENRAVAAMEQAQQAAAAATGGLTAAQVAAVQAAVAATRASNDNAEAVKRQGEAFRAAGRFIVEHPLLVAAGSVAAAKALSGLSGSAAAYLAAAGVAVGQFGERSTSMGGAVAAGASAAARGLGLASTAAGAAATGLGRYAETVGGMTTTTGLLARALSVLPGIIGPAGLAFLAFELGAAAIGKAYADLDRLVQLGQRAEGMNIGAGFVKAFDALGPKIRASADEMQEALKRAAGFVQDRFNQVNALQQKFAELQAGGFTGGGPLRAERELDLATSTEGRIRAALSAMQELEERGLRLASLDLGAAVFGTAVVDRMRQGNISAEQIAANLVEASRQQVVDEAAVQRALEQARAIEDTKRRIREAVDVTLDFSQAAENVNALWLTMLQTVANVTEGVNNLGNAIRNNVVSALQSFGNLPIWGQINEFFDKYGLMDKDWRKNGVQPPTVAPTPAEPAITARQFPYTFGPNLPAQQAAREAKQAAQETASAYDLLIAKTEDRIKELDLETESVGKSTTAVLKLKLANDLARAAQKSGIEVTEDMRRQWDALGDRVGASTERLNDARRSYELMKETQRELAEDFSRFAEDVILGGKSMGQAFDSLAKSLSSNTLKAVLMGDGPLASLFGTAPSERGQVGGLLGTGSPVVGEIGGFDFSDTEEMEAA